MKRLIIFPIIVLFSFSLFSQGIVRVEVKDFKEENDSLVLNYAIYISPQAIETGQSYQITLQVQAADSVLVLPGVTILGANKQKVLSRFNTHDIKNCVSSGINKDTVVTHTLKVPYALWMDSSSLFLKQELSGYRGESTISSYKLREEVDLSYDAPYRVHPAVSFIFPKKEEKHRERKDKIYLDFQSGSSSIVAGYRRNPEELVKLYDIIRDVVDNPDFILQGFHIEGYASPEGPYAFNERLSRQRAESLKEYIRGKFRLNESLFKVTSVAEDWDGLVKLVDASDMPQKDNILMIISALGIHEGREAALMKLDGGIPYRLMLSEMFPDLRRVEYRMDYTVVDYDVEQTLALLQNNTMGNLSQFELYSLALSYGKDSDTFNKLLMETIPRYFYDDSAANNNAAAIMILKGESATAKRYLQKAGNTSSAINNQGIVYLLEEDVDKAESCFIQAQNMGCQEAAVNLKEVQAKRRDNKKMERYQNRK